jgi:hypothetical protein
MGKEFLKYGKPEHAGIDKKLACISAICSRVTFDPPRSNLLIDQLTQSELNQSDVAA